MLARKLSIYDVAAQVMIALLFHWTAGDDWTFLSVTSRIGFVLPLALSFVWLWRWVECRKLD